jgi:hypothetical protein
MVELHYCTKLVKIIEFKICSVNYNLKTLKNFSITALKLESGTLKTLQGIKQYITGLQDISIGHVMYKYALIEILLGFLISDDDTGCQLF